jgi:hypothetical protein
VPGGGQLDQVLVADVILGKQHEVEVALASHPVDDARLPLEPGTRRDIRFDADDGFQSVLRRLAPETHHAEQIAVIGDGQRLLAVRRCARTHLVDLLRAVEQRVRRVVVKVNETGTRAGHLPPLNPARPHVGASGPASIETGKRYLSKVQTGFDTNRQTAVEPAHDTMQFASLSRGRARATPIRSCRAACS